jgi:hypothetical protein
MPNRKNNVANSIALPSLLNLCSYKLNLSYRSHPGILNHARCHTGQKFLRIFVIDLAALTLKPFRTATPQNTADLRAETLFIVLGKEPIHMVPRSIDGPSRP